MHKTRHPTKHQQVSRKNQKEWGGIQMFWINHPKVDFTKNIQFSSIREFAMSLQNLNLFHLIFLYRRFHSNLLFIFFYCSIKGIRFQPEQLLKFRCLNRSRFPPAITLFKLLTILLNRLPALVLTLTLCYFNTGTGSPLFFN